MVDTIIKARISTEDKQLIEEAAGKGNMSKFIISASVNKAKRVLAQKEKKDA